MVLRPSDYRVRNLWGSWNPFNPKSTLFKAVGTFVAVTMALVVLMLAASKGVPLWNKTVGRLTGGVADTGRQPRVF